MIQVASGALGPGARTSKRGAWYLIYDGDCAFCMRCLRLLQEWDRPRRMRFLPFQDAAELVKLPWIPRASLERAMHLVAPDDTIFAGAAAVPPILRLLRGGRLLSWIFRVPGVSSLAARMYRIVAKNRHRLGCGSGTCSLGDPK